MATSIGALRTAYGCSVSTVEEVAGGRTSEPASYGVRRVACLRVEANLRRRRMSMNDVDQLLEQEEVGRGCTDAGADHDAVERLLRQLLRDDGLGRLAQIDEAELHLVPRGSQRRGVGLELSSELLGREPREEA